MRRIPEYFKALWWRFIELFPNRQRRQPRIVQAEEDLNLEVEKIIGHERRRNGIIRFLCKWEGFSDEDATYRAADDFKTSPYGIKVVKDYILSFGETPEELKEWVLNVDWIHDSIMEEWNKVRSTAGSSTDVPEASGASNDSEKKA